MADEKKKETEWIEENPLNKQPTVEPKKKTFGEKFRYVRENVTVEPLLGGLIIPSVLSRFAMANFNLDKACRVNLNFGDEICDAVIAKNNKSTNYSFYEEEIQALIASIDIWKSIISTALPCIMIIFLGAWSDRTGKRKIIILLPVFGEFLTSINNLINVYFFYEIPVEITVFLETFFPAVTGGWVTMFLGVFSYISDITTEENRTFRVGMVNFGMTAGVPIGVALSGILLKKLGYYGIFSLTAVMFILVLCYGFICLSEPDKLLKKKGMPPIERKDTSDVSFFDVTHVAETVRVAYKPRPANKRLRIIFTLFTVFILFGPAMSEHHVFYLFLRNRLNWDMTQFGIFSSYSIVLHSFGTIFAITVLSRRLQIDDSLLCLLSISSKFVGSIWIAFVRTDIEMYLVPVVEFFNGATFTSLRSIISKLVEKQETAKVNSLFSLTETVAALLFHPLYSWVYMQTLSEFSGAVFLISSALIIPASVVLISFYVHQRISLRKSRKKALEEEERKEEEQKKSPLSFNPVDNVEIDSVLGVIDNPVQIPVKAEESDDIKKES